MLEAIALLLGLALGIWQTRRLRQAARQLLHGARPARRRLAAHFARRLLPPVLLLALLLPLSLAAAGAALGGYWLGRTLLLAHDFVHIGARG
jgi:hypothetical protein